MTSSSRSLALPVYLQPVFLCLFVAVLTALKIFAASHSHFVEDEAYYRIWGLYPAWSYYDHPPMIGWWIAAGQAIFGDTVFAARSLVIFTGPIGSLALWRTAAILFDRRTAGWAVLFLNTSLLVGIGGILATPDAPTVFFWGVSLWALAELVRSDNPNWWLVVGLMAGLGLLSKYSVLFLGAGIVLWLIWSSQARRWWSCWQLWAGGVIAVLCFSPVLLWNLDHEWVSFYKQFGRAGRGGYTAKYIFEFLGALIGLLNPLIAVLAALGSAFLFRKFRKGDTVSGLLILTVLPFLVYLMYHSLHSRVQANWPAPLFPAFALMAAVFVARDDLKVFWKRLAIAGVGLGTIVALVVQLHAVSPITGAFARKDPTFQLRGWPEIGNEIKTIAQKERAGFVLTSGYGLNGQLDFLLKGTVPVHQFTQRIRYVMAPPVDENLFAQSGLYVAEARRDQSEGLKAVFEDVEKVATLQRKVKDVPLEDLVVYKVQGPNGAVLEPVSTK